MAYSSKSSQSQSSSGYASSASSSNTSMQSQSIRTNSTCVEPYNKNSRIKLRSLLNTRNMYPRFPINHTLTKVSANTKEHRIFLLRQIMSQDVGVSSRTLPNWGQLKVALELHLLPILAQLIDNHRKYNYKEALLAAFRKNQVQFPDVFEASSVDTRVILCFVSDVLYNVLPHELIGRNMRGLQKLARCMVRGHIPLFMKHLMNHVTGNLTCGWLTHAPSTLLRRHMAAKLTHWVAAEYIPGVIKSVLFGTRMASGKCEPVYFTKPTWQSRARKELNHLVETGCLQKLPKQEFNNDRLEPGVLRFLPKASGLRPIVVRKLKQDELINRINKAKLLMKKINPPALRLNDEWIKFRNKLIDSRKAGDKRRILFVKTDVKSAFVTVRQEKVLQVLASHMTNFPSQVLVEMAPGNLWMQRRLGGSSQASQSGQDSISGCSQASQSSKPVASRTVAVSRDVAHKTLRLEVEQQVVRHGTRRYKMLRGLAQGSPLSNNLCNMTFNDLYQTRLSQFNKPQENSVLWRVADDFLLLTLDEDVANRFKACISAGFPDYGWQMSVEKSVDNLSDEESNEVCFNGAFFDLMKLEVMADLSQYTADNVLFSMSFKQITPTIEELFKRQLLAVGSLKVERLFLNMSIKSRQGILEQISSSAKLQALRLRALTRFLMCQEAKNETHSLYIAQCIWKSSGRLCERILRLLQASIDPKNSAMIPSANEIKWLLNMAVYQRSSGYLGKARNMLKHNLFKLEAQISPEDMKLCYAAHSVSKRWDAQYM